MMREPITQAFESELASEARPSVGGVSRGLAEGVVEETSPGSGPRALRRGLVVVVGDRTVEATRAASCLLEPAPGDRVLVYERATGEVSFVLAVLERELAASTEVALGGGVAIRVEERRLSVEGAQEISLAPAAKLSVEAPTISIRADRVGALTRRVEVIGQAIESSFDTVKSLARTVESLADTVTASMKRSLRFVSDLDQTRAKHVDTRAEGQISLDAENTFVTARAVTKIDSAQVHIG